MRDPWARDSSRVRWRRADDGFVSSHCGRWNITPIYGGLTRPESYELRLDYKVVGTGQTQRECKWTAEQVAESRGM